MTKEKIKKPGSPGFSLTEVLIAVAVLAIASAIAVPILSSSMRSMQLAADAQNISSSLSSARLNSKSSMIPHRISFSIVSNEWRLEEFNPNTGLFEPQQDINQLSRGITGSGITFLQKSGSHPVNFPSESSGAITFNARGIPVDASNTPTPNNIVYLSKPGTDYAVSVTLTGKVQIWKNNEGRWEAQ